MLLDLSTLAAQYQHITIQCHNNPDPDTICCGYALYDYFNQPDKKVTLLYSGQYQISKPNLLKLIDTLKIPLIYQPQPEATELLITVDGQFGSGNVEPIDAKQIITLDHHRDDKLEQSNLTKIIRSDYGSCSTLIWEILQENEVTLTPNVTTALYYGLVTDTDFLRNTEHAKDKAMHSILVDEPDPDSHAVDLDTINQLCNAELALDNMSNIGSTLNHANRNHNGEYGYTVYKCEPCDPNIIGLLGDLVIKVAETNVSIIYFITEDNSELRYSIRSCRKKHIAGEMAAFLAGNYGNGGGHADKAGGYIKLPHLKQAQPNTSADAYLTQRIENFFTEVDEIYHNNHELEQELADGKLKPYLKKPVIITAACASDIFPKGHNIRVRTLEGNTFITASPEHYFVVGIEHELYPVKMNFIQDKYDEHGPAKNITFSRPTHLQDMDTNQTLTQLHTAKNYVSKPKVIYAKQLTRFTRVYTSWNDGSQQEKTSLRTIKQQKQHHMYGEPGDYLVMQRDNHSDIYVVKQNIFTQLYEEMRSDNS